MTTGVLPASFNNPRCRAFLFAAGAPRYSPQTRAELAVFAVKQLTVQSPAKISISRLFVKANGVSARKWAENLPSLKNFYTLQIAISSLTVRIFYDWFSKVGLHFRAKQRASTQARWRSEYAARNAVR